MRITVITICYNEAEIIYNFLEHYYWLGANRIVIYDNKSTDGTIDICKDFEKSHQGCKIEIIEYDSNNEIRDDLYIEIKNNAWKKFKSDYYIVVDCDEFLVLPTYLEDEQSDRKKLVRYLSTMKKGYILPRVQGVQCISDTFDEFFDSFSDGSLTEKQYVIDDTFNKRCIFSKELVPVYKPGCHMFSINPKDRDKLNASIVAEKKQSPLYLFHLKYIDRSYVIDRYEEFRERLSEFNKKNEYGHQYTMSETAINLKFDYFKKYAITLEEVFQER